VEQQSTTDRPLSSAGERSIPEHGLGVLWERVRQAGELIRQLRQEKAALTVRVADLEDRLRALDTALQTQRERVRSLEAAQQERMQGGTPMDEQERAALLARVREALAKLDAYL
jgi:uncharacterized coiled-coil DUF342 family protein